MLSGERGVLLGFYSLFILDPLILPLLAKMREHLLIMKDQIVAGHPSFFSLFFLDMYERIFCQF